VITGRKTRRERFAGAVNTMTLEGMMGDGKALQLGTSHELGQNFARAFDITYTDAEQREQLAWTTSWGSSTRMLGGLIMCHGDDSGLRIPPKIAPTQVVITVVKDADATTGPTPRTVARRLADELGASGVRVAVDDRTDVPFGRRAVDHELKGIPVRLDVGPRDLVDDQVMLVRRIPGSRQPTRLDQVTRTVSDSLRADQDDLYATAEQQREDRTSDVSTVDAAIEAARDGWARIDWRSLGEEGESKLAEHGVTVRCLLRPDGSVPDTDDSEVEPDLLAVVARAY
jgi:prolyl-tRNA synthetase